MVGVTASRAGAGALAFDGLAGRLAWVMGVTAAGWDAIGLVVTGFGESGALDTGATRAALTGGKTGGRVTVRTAGGVRTTGPDRTTGAAVR